MLAPMVLISVISYLVISYRKQNKKFDKIVSFYDLEEYVL